jgi:hypothetical protein
MHFNSYCSTLNIPGLAESVSHTTTAVYSELSSFDHSSQLTGLLLGNVQSGKTAQVFGNIAHLADNGFDLFVLLTSDSVYLHTQTFQRAVESLAGFTICHEDDELRFTSARMSKPTLLILKKNARILERWRNALSSSGFITRPLVIFDDEADAASQNTKVNRNGESTVYRNLESLKALFTSCIYIQVTATPQAVLLQSTQNSQRPSFVHYFPPGNGYTGGDFVYSEPISYCIALTPENEFDQIRSNTDQIPLGLRTALFTFLVICSEYSLRNRNNCNFLVHPSVRINDHETFAVELGSILNSFLIELTTDEVSRDEFLTELRRIWGGLRVTHPDISAFEDIKERVEKLLTDMAINTVILNSNTNFEVSYNEGFNIIIGGNSLGRGVTIPKLQVVYYCRRSQNPQADTLWQHSRVFGYDRERGLLRVFLPTSIHTRFVQLNNANVILIRQIQRDGLEGIQLLYPQGIRPTRPNVIPNQSLNLIVGGVNYFSGSPDESNKGKLDKKLIGYDENSHHIISGADMEDLLKICGNYDWSDWDKSKFISCVKALIQERPQQQFCIIVRRNRNISKGTGTLLSPNDRTLGDSLTNETVLTLYRVEGASEKGWNGNPFWIPNIKFPDGVNFYDTI